MKRDEKFAAAWRKAGPYAGIGTTLVSSVCLGTYVGYRVDEARGSSPWGILVGSIAGMVLGFYYFYRVVARMTRARSELHDD